ncbi:MAG: hypothetical protein JXQ80_04950 [Bacteroidales bacterium]|nr:hypothetical protein [Bacteroidales bacterium]
MKKIAILLSLIVLCCSGCKYFKKSSSKKVETITADTTASEEVIDSAAYYADMAASAQAAENNAQPAIQPSSTGGDYHMIVGCFTVQAYADKYAEKMRNQGYDGQIIQGRDNFKMVTARSYSSYRESVNEIAKFRNEVTPNAWVYRQR